MGIIALVMAGGKGTRLQFEGEKPLLNVADKPMIEHVLDALRKVNKIERIVVAVSKHTPETARMMEKRFSIQILKTPGKDYVFDIQYAIKKLKLNTVLTISADLPLVTSEIIEEIIKRYERCEKPALEVAVPVKTIEKLGLIANHVFEVGGRLLAPAGINVIDGRQIDEMKLDEEVFVVDRKEVAVNVNTLENLKVAEHLLSHLT
ncbi:MAG: NTP transferase domain-containing protein [Candidatus Bathyarchaeota archaeon]|nr:MAG: NTP transferase domain-containing protein [Candidatus Bathyarchaeota archaeon]